ncbi:tubulin monoglutamylase TTLL4 isoform X3 [Xiphophorus hellerii]|uniref:tubulin monoglutamylase TTLL4 isoform X3 n=1 Tax=Xiphophorus hellerii TaxID=8084 RepID=UPI0013B3895F|nr:tubulin polyglutamylase TTLL4 isoform X3 [Xiphophorus hellerii]
MPTNQSSLWGGGNLRACSNTHNAPTAALVSGATFKSSFRHTPPELPKATSIYKHLPSAGALSMMSSVCSVWEKDSGNSSNTRSHHLGSEKSVKQSEHQNRTQRPNQNLAASEPNRPNARTMAQEVQLRGVTEGCLPTQILQSGDGLVRSQDSTDHVPLESSPGCHGDLFIKGHATVPRIAKLMPKTIDCSSSPPVPHLSLKLSKHQGTKLWKNTSGHNGTKQETRSTKWQLNAPRRGHSTKAPTKHTKTQNGRATRSPSRNQRLDKFGPAGVLVAAANRKSHSAPLPRLSTCRGLDSSLCSNVPAVRCGDQRLQPTGLHAVEGVAPCLAGALVGSVTNQISAIHLTKEGQSSSTSTQSLYSSSSVTEEQLMSLECVMQVDGMEEELLDELENAFSDDDDSECYSIIRSSSSDASIPCISSIEEPMVLGAEDDREEQPALVPSLFPLMRPTLYFSTANEKVELLPAEQRRLLKWKMSSVTPNIVKHTIARSHFKATKKSNNWLGCWGHHMKSPGFKAIGEHQKLNHFPGTFQIGRKDRLWRNLSKMQHRFGKQEFDFFPKTFILPQDIKLLRKAWEDSGSRKKWIIKPPASARGMGIQVIHKWSQLPRKRPLLVQKYLHKPYLIGGNKFDLRIYVYVTSYEPLRIYLFSDGLVRFASCKYSSSMKTLNNKFMHLTNYSVNKMNSEYQTNSDDKACQGHKWALKALWHFLGSKGINTNLIWEKIKDIVIKTIIASEPYVNTLLKMHVKTPHSCHELFGFDIMLDENLKPWILEVNISPSLHSNSALDVSIKGQMIRDLLNLAGFRIPPREEVVSSCSSASSSTSSLHGGNKEKRKSDLSADEKVKRAFYLAQRYADQVNKCMHTALLQQDFLSSVLDILTPEDVRVLAESEDELNRRGEFERIFPSHTSSRYLRFFECPRYLNILLDQWEQKHCNDRTKCISLLRLLCHKGIHLGSSDPAHMWSKYSYKSRLEPLKPGVVSPSRSRVVVSHRNASDDDCSDPESPSVSSLPSSQSTGSSVSSSARASPQPTPFQNLLPQHFSSF